MTLAERLWAKVDVRGPDQCWLWRGACNNDGYPVARVDGRLQLVTRLVLAAKRGRRLTARQKALHSCDNPPCVNPAHLSAGTQAENQRQMAERGRSSRGEQRPNAKLTEAQALAIRADGRPSSLVAAEHGVSASTVRLVRQGKRWGWVA